MKERAQPMKRPQTEPAWQAELAERAVAIRSGTRRRGRSLDLPRAMAHAIEGREARARRFAREAAGDPESRRFIALDFIAGAAFTLVGHGAPGHGDVRAMVEGAGEAIGLAADTSALVVFLRGLGSTDLSGLPPQRAVTLGLEFLLELGPAEAASVWKRLPSRSGLRCVATAGEAPTTRRLRAAAGMALAHGVVESPHVRAVVIERWDQPFAAIAARSRSDASATLSMYLDELARALSPLFERETLFELSEARERTLVAGVERRLLRLAFDLHDGPLQDLIALREDIRLARMQMASLVEPAMGRLVAGRFDDLDSRLIQLDKTLRQVARSARSTTVVEQPLESALRKEVDALGRTTAIETELTVDGDVSMLTSSQKIALFRVVQESLANIRRHSGATKARVRVRSAPRYVTLVITDNGNGFDSSVADRTDRLGLAGVVERVRLLGGDVEIDGRPGKGARIRATLPQWFPAGSDSTDSVYSVVA